MYIYIHLNLWNAIIKFVAQVVWNWSIVELGPEFEPQIKDRNNFVLNFVYDTLQICL